MSLFFGQKKKDLVLTPERYRETIRHMFFTKLSGMQTRFKNLTRINTELRNLLSWHAPKRKQCEFCKKMHSIFDMTPCHVCLKRQCLTKFVPNTEKCHARCALCNKPTCFGHTITVLPLEREYKQMKMFVDAGGYLCQPCGETNKVVEVFGNTGFSMGYVIQPKEPEDFVEDSDTYGPTFIGEFEDSSSEDSSESSSSEEED